MTATITESELHERSANFLNATLDLIQCVEGSLVACVFDNGPSAREQAEKLHAHARQFYAYLLKTWPDDSAPGPGAEVQRR